MLTKINNTTNDMNTFASDAINSYIRDGYRIDAKESVIDREKDKDCTFKAVLKKDVDGIECKTTITLSDFGDDKNKSCKYHKVETVGDTKWSEETRTFSHSTDKSRLNNVVDKVLKSNPMCSIVLDDDQWIKNHRKRMQRILDDWDMFGSDSFFKTFKHIEDLIKIPDLSCDTCKKDKDNNVSKCEDKCTTNNNSADNTNKNVVTKCECKCTKDNSQSDNDTEVHIKIHPTDSENDIYNKIVNRKKNLENVCKCNKTINDKRIDAMVDKIKAEAANNVKNDNLPKQDPDDEIEDSLIKLVRYIFGK